MKYLSTWSSAFVTFLGGLIGFLYGGLTPALTAVLLFIVLDFITGVMTAFVEKKLSSDKAFRGVVKKFFELLIIAGCHIIDVDIIGEGSAVMTAVCFLFVSTEGISVLENAARMGVPIPKKLFDVLAQLKITNGAIISAEELEEEQNKVVQEDDVYIDKSTTEEVKENKK